MLGPEQARVGRECHPQPSDPKTPVFWVEGGFLRYLQGLTGKKATGERRPRGEDVHVAPGHMGGEDMLVAHSPGACDSGH